MTSAAIQGSGHKRSGTPCQDKTYKANRNSVKVISLADGAGSAKLSEYGASVISKVVAEYAIDNFLSLRNGNEANVKQCIATLIRDELGKLSAVHECDANDLSSTLLLVAIRKNAFVAFHIGDGVIGIYEKDSVQVLSAPENGEYANQTWFTTTRDLESAIRLYRGDVDSISGFILMSDGVEPSLYNIKENKLADAVINLFYTNAKIDSSQMERLLAESLEQVISTRTRDDCSIAILSRTRFKRFNEYSKYRKRIAKRSRVAKGGE